MAQRDKNPGWWSKDDTSTWDRVKEALKRDWEQTKHDFTSKSGKELNQDVDDTLRQAAGKQSIPPPATPNADAPKGSSTAAKPIAGQPIAGHSIRDDEWARNEDAVRYGFGAARQYGDREWDQKLEGDLKNEWTGYSTDTKWDDVKDNVRHGWNGRRQKKDEVR